ncbi:hypothetical protein GCM10007301_11390 [Azorhizobium oxalatiphilum]|uniref:Uncharacterized protein n=1 Tax=Azorhizobium oxalatiphilum TaxID=980631 RepID=A0A917BRT7_9HYPH|nr:hypothetical protein [Azorhizobium oxalatiphilum]GGF53654.1 hypothetical protein GCM10007301_11390 [Azorhizobium oxalatiphilum]
MVGTAKAFAKVGMAALLLATSIAAPAHAANFLEKNFWLPNDKFSGNVPACTEPLALGTISNHFAETERLYWQNGVNIANYYNVREIANQPWGEGFVPRRYCTAAITLTNETKPRTIYYSIIEEAGFMSTSWGVEWCIEGYDREFAYAPNCKMARP